MSIKREWMPPKAPKLEILAVELETQPREDLTELLAHVRDNEYPRYKLIEELRLAKLGFFAKKLHDGWYDALRK